MSESISSDDVSQLRAELRHLRDELARVTALVDTAAQPSYDRVTPAPSPAERSGRRDLFKTAGAAALGATVIGLLDAAPAGAADGNPVLLGEVNAASATTEVDTNTGDGLLGTTSANGSAGAAGSDVSTSGGYGVYGQSTNGVGVYGTRPTQSGMGPVIAAVVGDSGSSEGVIGLSSHGDAIGGQTSATGASGIAGFDTSVGGGVGLFGESTNGYGLVIYGGLAPLRMYLGVAPGAPSSGAHLLGELYADSNGTFWKCVVAGSPGTWVPLYSVVPLPAPVRVLSTPSGARNAGGLTGPFNPDGVTHTTSVLTGGVTGIPAIAVGVVGNLAISGNGSTLNGDGYLTLFPAGRTNPGTSSINAGGGAFASSNGITVALGTGADEGKLSFSWQGGGSPLPCQVFLDVTGYIL